MTFRFPRLTALIFVLGFTIQALPTSADGVAPAQMQIANDEALIYISEDDDDKNWGSQLVLQPGPPDENLVRDPWIFCESVEDPKCDFDKPNYGPSASINLRHCETVTAADCLADIRIFKSDELLAATYVGEVPGSAKFPAAPELGLFESGAASLFSVPDAPHSGGDLYLASVRVTSNYEKSVNKFVHTDLYALIIPVSIQQLSGDTWYECVWVFDGRCGQREQFPQDLTLGLEMRVVNELGGWFLGRVADPAIVVEKFSNRNNRIVIDARPVEVARFAYLTKKSEISAADKIAVGNVGGADGLANDRPTRLANSGFDTTTFGMLENFRTRVQDTAAAITKHWRVRTTSRNGNNQCLTKYDQVLGIVSTNATAYDGFAPEFKDGYINYSVAGLHYKPNGKDLNIGTYDLVMRSETARCLYGFDKAPVSATVQVVGTGDQNIATTVVSEKDGWLKLAAYGFTFSEKEIKVKLSQPQSKTLTKFVGSGSALTSKQKAEIKATVTKAKGNAKFICTGVYVNAKDKTTAIKRARAACGYAKSLDKNFSFWSQAKPTSAKSYDAKVMIVSK